MESLQTFLNEVFIAKGSEAGPLAAAVRTIIVFVAAVFYVRVAKKRFIAQASAVDLVMVVVFGSTLSRAINGGATLLSSLAAGLVLVALQRLFAHFGVRYPGFGTMVKGSFETLVKDGAMDHHQMRLHDISEADLRSELRINGMTDDVSEVALATLERSGRISVVKKRG